MVYKFKELFDFKGFPWNWISRWTRIGNEEYIQVFKALFRRSPEFIEGDTFRIIIPLSAIAVGKVGPEEALQISTHDSAHDSTHDVNGWLLEEILGFCKEPRSKQEIMDHLGYKEQRTFTRRYLRPLLDKGYLQMTLPDKPQSHYQRYVTSSEAFASESLSWWYGEHGNTYYV